MIPFMMFYPLWNRIYQIKLEEVNNELKLTIPLNHTLAKGIIFNLKLKQKNNNFNNSNDL